MKKNASVSFLAAAGCCSLLLALPGAAQITVIHSWDMGESEGGVAGGTADGTLLDGVGDLDVEPAGLPLYAAIGGGIGVFFNNQNSAHNLEATEYFSNAEADVNPTDFTKWGIEALVRIDVLPAANQELAVFELGGGSTGISLETFGAGAWGLHQSNVGITSAASPVKVGVRQHLAAVRNNGRWELYVDGLLAASFASAEYDPAPGIRIGAGNVGSGNNRGFNGVIDTVRIFEYTDTFDVQDTLLSVINPDTDRDGFDNTVEIALGFDPGDPASTPESLTDIETGVEFSFYAGKNFRYRIESSTDLQNWEPVENNITGLGGEITRLYSTRGAKARHYRAVRAE